MVVALGAFLDSIGRLSKDEVAILFTEADEFAELEAADHPQVAAVYRCLAKSTGYPACNARSTRLRPRLGRSRGDGRDGARHPPAPGP